ncbi:sensor histidine kinase [Demequina sp. NBRC 110054]|uniref:sensor histidine kinase n=1 Tax=Demequina sp. NBRC 110054 TaxID=1570343 RepID=UPI000A020CFE|nr:ATP-binding protein [Demequina sp. NBRC 110054]
MGLVLGSSVGSNYGAGPAAARTARAVIAVSAVTQIMYLGINLEAVTAQWETLRPAYGVALAGAGALAILTPPLLARFVDHRQLATYVRTTAVLHLAIVALWPAMILPGAEPAESSPWPHLFIPFTMMTAATSFAPAAIVVFGAASATVSLPLLISSHGTVDEPTLVDWIGAYGPPIIFGGLVVGVMMYAMRLDAALASARSAVVSLAEREARSRVRAAVNSAIHDDVLAVLSMIKIDPTSVSDSDLDRATQRIATLTEEDHSTDLAPATFASAVAEATYRWMEDAIIDVSGARTHAIPHLAAAALLDASGEAMRNSTRHAGSPSTGIHREVHVRLSDSEVAVTIADDGAGFDPAAVAPDRLGVAVSIKDRMAMLAGGHAQLTSAPGEGTLIELTWRP